MIFNRPDTTEQVFAEIRKQQPKYLFIAADGPRDNKPDDVEQGDRCRQIVSRVDWDCEIQTLYQSKNLGCGLAPATAITWFFTQVMEGIILEDDCIPNGSFFEFCENLLATHRHNINVMMICGTSYQPQPLNNDTYYFSQYPHVWGWATWRRAWTKYNFKLDNETNTVRANVIRNTFFNSRERRLWEGNMKMIINGLDAWDYQWMYWMWKNNGLCAVPWKNMISNIGFGPHATHTFNISSNQNQMEQHTIEAIHHPKQIAINKKADSYERYHILIGSNGSYYANKLKSGIKKIIKILFKNNAK
ncbi:nucleotide-diphospho-sugar transferase [Mucilaginibacter sp. FT3.2]|uniref:nucleotide-diphospho-sugar transferase n=1 Tax=Mucilaginibacter sp. FT3.2 TaxID=2723090 RepID=UPI00160CC05D|nr:nucleotide-diphospho-sugar transferase [Mucilaginibacter sp. FT3.2]MBB6231300.1 hypothetical protein [Mucilaginibacter sp. FT3.2]